MICKCYFLFQMVLNTMTSHARIHTWVEFWSCFYHGAYFFNNISKLGVIKTFTKLKIISI